MVLGFGVSGFRFLGFLGLSSLHPYGPWVVQDCLHPPFVEELLPHLGPKQHQYSQITITTLITTIPILLLLLGV